jgi:type I restriction enzyme S subunit
MITKEFAVEIAAKARAGLERIYGHRLKGAYLFGSFARGQANDDSDIDIAVVLDEVGDLFAEIERTSEFGAQLGLDIDRLVTFQFVSEPDFQSGRYAIHRTIKQEGIPV